MSVIQTSQLSKFYGPVRGIEEVDLQVEEGEVFGFIGPNGAGKSTTIRLLLNLIFPSAGHAQMLGKDVIKEAKQLKRQVGYLPSEVHYYDHMTVKELMEYSVKFYHAQLDQRYDELMERFEVDPSRQLRDLSSGNKKKVAIIQALLHRPKLLILDEPTNGLDPLMQNVFFDVLAEANNRGTTIFFSSHILGDVQRICQRVAVIRKGKIVEINAIDELMKKQWKKCRVELAGALSEQQFSFDGVKDLQLHDHRAFFNYSGHAEALLAHLSQLPVTDINIENQTLEEIFMRYYE